MTTYGIEELTAMRGESVYSADGEKIGKVEEVYVDQETGQPEWLGLGTGFFGTKRVLVPVQGAQPADDGLRVPYDKAQVQETPDVDAEQISQDTEAQLYRHYGLEYSERQSDTGLPEGGRADRTAGATDIGDEQTSVTRSEEELAVGKRETEAGRIRLHKWTETEQVDVPVEVRREKARVTTEEINEPTDATIDRTAGDEELEVTLREEQPVVDKQTVAKERIGIEKDVETETETVSDEVRKERVDVDAPDDSRR